jgi:hypothetical protein
MRATLAWLAQSPVTSVIVSWPLRSWLKHNSYSYGDAMPDDFHENSDAANSGLEDMVRELETRLETLTAKLSNPTEEMMLAGALAHNAGLRPMRAAITAAEAKKIFKAMIAVLLESKGP